ncbi:tagatose-6-phosphate kinase [Virgibacillus phasianinus]|uniref:Tagatose-6-phosphate kinase n=1 Tax=Virgibacillus phasianinus TaxID=2017483 RepID=A0A220U3C7_9BACI|nr:hexose kinase [Virgibacillus phasianinus]ASK62233.1 tagatose-6-phosphate kinase [Virgibacillus phasianinus]
MILTVTLNPAVDISYKLEKFNLDTVNRVQDISKTAGGKGLNVTRVLEQLGEEVAATGFLGGGLGDFIRTDLSGIQDYFVTIEGETRNCIAVIHEGKQTEILESGPVISGSEGELFLASFSEYVQKVDIITISGSLPRGLPDDFYEKVIRAAGDTPVLLDTKGELLKKTLKSKPYVIKPNVDELGDLLGRAITDEQDIVAALGSEIFADIPWVVVTNGADGAVVKHNDAVYQATIPQVKAVNPVGSGDAVLAGFAAGLSRGLADEDLIKFGLAMGVLNALEEQTGHITPEKIDWCIGEISGTWGQVPCPGNPGVKE